MRSLKVSVVAASLFFCSSALVLQGCDTESPVVPTESHTNKRSIVKDDSLLDAVVQRTGWKKEAVQALDSRLPDNRIFVALTIADDGKLLGSVPKQDGKPYEVVLFDPKTQKTETVATLQGDAQCAAADINDRWIVWSEVADQKMLLDWNMHVYDRQTHQDRIVFSSPKDSQTGHGFPGPLWSPHLYQDTFVFSPTTGPTRADGPGFVSKKYDLLTGSMTDISTTGYNPVMTNDGTYWIGYDAEEKDGELFKQQGTNVKQATKGASPKYFAAEGDAYAWSSLHKIEISEKGKIKPVASSGEADALQFLSMSSRMLAWTSYEKTQVYDRKLEKVVTLDERPAPTVYTKGHYLFWAIPSGTPEERQQAAKETGVVPVSLFLADLDKL